jgi:hypothetical protein
MSCIAWMVGMRALDQREGFARVRDAWASITVGEGSEYEPYSCLYWAISQQGIDLQAQPEADSWDRVNLREIAAAITSGSLKPVRPDIGMVEGTQLGLLVTGKVNGIHGAPGVGKSMLAEVIAVQEMARGNRVWFLDFEDDAQAVLERFIDLGVDPDLVVDRLHYKGPHDAMHPDTRDRILDDLRDERPTFVIADSVGEWLGLHGIEDKDSQVARFMADFPRMIASAGPAVALLDHVPHADHQRLAPVGSQRKLAAINGCQYLVTPASPLGRGQQGTVVVTVAKDRTGCRPKGSAAANLVLDATSVPTTARLVAPSMVGGSATKAGRRSMAQVLSILQTVTQPLTVAEIEAADKKTSKRPLASRTIHDALGRLEDEGQALRERGAAAGRADRWSAGPESLDDPP